MKNPGTVGAALIIGLCIGNQISFEQPPEIQPIPEPTVDNRRIMARSFLCQIFSYEHRKLLERIRGVQAMTRQGIQNCAAYSENVLRQSGTTYDLGCTEIDTTCLRIQHHIDQTTNKVTRLEFEALIKCQRPTSGIFSLDSLDRWGTSLTREVNELASYICTPTN